MWKMVAFWSILVFGILLLALAGIAVDIAIHEIGRHILYGVSPGVVVCLLILLLILLAAAVVGIVLDIKDWEEDGNDSNDD
jgi:hypothetical protein